MDVTIVGCENRILADRPADNQAVWITGHRIAPGSRQPIAQVSRQQMRVIKRCCQECETS